MEEEASKKISGENGSRNHSIWFVFFRPTNFTPFLDCLSNFRGKESEKQNTSCEQNKKEETIKTKKKKNACTDK